MWLAPILPYIVSILSVIHLGPLSARIKSICDPSHRNGDVGGMTPIELLIPV